MDVYDAIIIGGGIAGINTALNLSKKHKILLLDERRYWGGRIHTNYRPQYEIGAARFNSSHKLLMKLIYEYNLTPIELSQEMNYKDKNTGELICNANEVLDKYFTHIIKTSKKYTHEYLLSITLYEFMIEIMDRDIANRIVNMFGYNSEIKKMNAYDAIQVFKKDFVNTKYYILKEGLTRLCNLMITKSKLQGARCLNNQRVTGVLKHSKNMYHVITDMKTFYCKKVIFAVKAHQHRQFKILKPIHSMSKSIYNAELLRIYAKYNVNKNGPWFHDIKRTTTNSILRQVIPIDYKTGLIMISYTDGDDIKPFKSRQGGLHSDTVLKSIVKRELTKLFPEKNIPEPIYFKSHYWGVGAHHWKPGYNTNGISKVMINPIPNIYICGEAYSKKQAWIEGSLETSNEVIKKFK